MLVLLQVVQYTKQLVVIRFLSVSIALAAAINGWPAKAAFSDSTSSCKGVRKVKPPSRIFPAMWPDGNAHYQAPIGSGVRSTLAKAYSERVEDTRMS